MLRDEINKIHEARLRAKINQRIKQIRVTPGFYQMLIAGTHDVILYNFNPIERKLFGVPLVIDETITDNYFKIDFFDCEERK